MAMSLLEVVVLVAPFLASPSLGTGGTHLCSAGWKLVEDTCFVAFNYSLPWEESQIFCKKQGADLATISSRTKQMGIAAMLFDNVWIGLKDISRENFPVWVDGSDITYTSWLEGEPNNSQKWRYYGKNEKCVEMNEKSGFLWKNEPCSKTQGFLCGKPAERVPRCEDGWTRYDGGSYSLCYKVSEDRRSWWLAKMECKRLGAYLAYIFSWDEHDFVKGLLHEDTWIGRYTTGGRNFLTDNSLPFANWHPGRRGNLYSWNYYCFKMNRNSSYYWSKGACKVQLAYVCEKQLH